jgi:tetratricopeptide (TPR) repeat protein
VWLEKFPLLIIAMAVSLITVTAQREGITFGADLQIPPAQRIILAAANVPIYLGQLTVPIGLSCFYGYGEGGRVVPGHYSLVALLLPVLAWIIYRYRRYSWSLLGGGSFVLNIALLLQWTSVGQAMRADRYTYLPSIGWAMVIVQILAYVVGRSTSVLRFAAAAMAYALLLACVSYFRVPVWQDEMSVWNDMIAHDPQGPMAYADRAGSEYRRGEFRSALNDAETALRIEPTLSLARYNRGLILMKLSNFPEAVRELLPFAGIPGADTDLYENLVFGMMHTGRFAEAILFTDTLLQRDPHQVDALVKRGYCLARLGRLGEARKAIDRSIAMKADQADAWYTSAYVHLLAGDTVSACADCTRSLQWQMKDSVSEKARDRFMAHFCRPE